MHSSQALLQYSYGVISVAESKSSTIIRANYENSHGNSFKNLIRSRSGYGGYTGAYCLFSPVVVFSNLEDELGSSVR